MALPELIEIVPLAQPVTAEITVPGSKSITNRALILAALAEGEVTLNGALWSEDTQIMVECLHQLGFAVEVQPDPNEFCNRTIKVNGLGGRIPRAGTAETPLELFVGNAGTAARFLAAFVCLGPGVYRLSGVPRMHERPQAALFSALRELGYRVESEKGNDKLPVKISHADTENIEEKESGSVSSVPLWQKRKCRVSIEESSQFASALLLSSQVGNWEIEVVGENADESPYVAMTSKLMAVFPKSGGAFQIEPDASGGSYFWAVDTMELLHDWRPRFSKLTPLPRESITGFIRSCRQMFNVVVNDWPGSGWQSDAFYPAWMFNTIVSRKIHLADSIMTAIVTAPFGSCPTQFTDLGRLRVQECERVAALRTELTKCGVSAIEQGDTLTVHPAKLEDLHGAEIETYNDHRMAMCFAILGLKVPGIKIKNPACVKKTFPNFFQKIAAAPPHGLGAEIWEIKDGLRARQLSGDDLFAD
ncbi:MAG TPA: hypothetical protein VGO57_16350 [Verrucomicrobiae bacterium]|jgi:3-phosphoshikimate 1-carboxyvinyltransferase